MTVKERAAYVARKINKAVKDGSFELASGYLYSIFGKCRGCAVAAAAFAVAGLTPDSPDAVPSCGVEDCTSCSKGGDQKTCQVKCVQSKKMTKDDTYQLELGYEACRILYSNTYGPSIKLAEAKPKNPFFQLGKKLAIDSGHRIPASYTWP